MDQHPSQSSAQSQKIRTTPKDFFLNLGSILALYIVAVSFLGFIFDVINAVFPDVINPSYDIYSSVLRLEVSTLIVVFPIFMVLSYFIHKDLVAHVAKQALSFRKWLIYLTLFLSGVTLAVDLIVLLNTFLSGEITTRFILKFISVFVVAGLIFWYYISDLRGTYYAEPKRLKLFGWIVTILVIISIVVGFILMGSPSTQRSLRFDSQRVQDLSSLGYQITFYYQQMGALPPSLAQLQDPISNYMVPTDPETTASYEYSVVSNEKMPQFSLCATFDLASNTTTAAAYPLPGGIQSDPASTNFKHTAGRTCFTRTIDPAKYPVLKNGPAGSVPASKAY